MDEPTTCAGWLGRSRGFWHAVACLALVLLTLGTFLNALENEFVSFDDWFLIEENTAIRSLDWSHLARIFTPDLHVAEEGEDASRDAWLPLRVLSYAVDYHFWGLNAFGYHLTNVLLHAANAVLVYFVLSWLLRRPALALLGAAWFAVHPVQVESVTWASGRRDVLYAFFFLLSYLAFLAHERQCGRPRWVLYGASLLLFAFSLMSKASAMMLPAVLVLTVLLFEGAREPLRRRLALCLPYLGLAAGMVAVHFLVAERAGVVKGRLFGVRLPSVPWIFASYLRMLFFPVNLSTPHSRGAIAASDTWLIVGSAAAVVAMVLLAWAFAPRKQVALFCLGWWFALLLPVSNLLPLSMLTAERYLYLPLVGACGFGAALVGSLTGPRRWIGAAAAVVVLGLLATASCDRNRAWRTSLSFWQDSVSNWPDAPIARIGLGITYVEADAPELAWREYLEVALPTGEAASEDPEHTRLVYPGLRRCYERVALMRERKGEEDAALNVYETMVRLLPSEAKPRARLAEAYERYGRIEQAREQVLAIEKLDKDYPGLQEWLKRLGAAKAEAASEP